MMQANMNQHENVYGGEDMGDEEDYQDEEDGMHGQGEDEDEEDDGEPNLID